jgi:indole-3-glycerol phosphate synthase
MGVLDAILENKRSELPALRQTKLPPPPPKRPVLLRRKDTGQLNLIAEIKRRSPSAGELSRILSISERAAAYDRAGAAMISVLCDRKYFDGHYSHLSQARSATRVPIMCKEFIIDECQLDAAAAFGADAVLLIVRCLSPERLEQLIVASRDRDLVPLVEVHGSQETTIALDAGATLVGVNARDLDTLEMDATGAARILQALPAPVNRIHLSGIASAEAVAQLTQTRTDASLIGEALMREDDPSALLESMTAAARIAKAPSSSRP